MNNLNMYFIYHPKSKDFLNKNNCIEIYNVNRFTDKSVWCFNKSSLKEERWQRFTKDSSFFETYIDALNFISSFNNK